MMLAGLAPEGTREWHDRRSGLPTGATKTIVAGQYEQVTVAIACLGVSVAQRNIRVPYLSFIRPRFTNRGRRSRGGKRCQLIWLLAANVDRPHCPVRGTCRFFFCFFKGPGRTFWTTSSRIHFCSGCSYLQPDCLRCGDQFFRFVFVICR